MTPRLHADADLTATLARMLAATARPGDTILLDGPVGAGKSHFARAFIRARQGEAAEEVPSPTFTLVQTYPDPAGTEIWHADLYRLADPSELAELGLDEALGSAICLVEWPDRLDRLPSGAIAVAIAPHSDPDLRTLTLIAPDADRIAARAGFVAGAGWGDARIVPLAGDASARRYFRLTGARGRAVLMDDPSGATRPFVAMTDWLRGHGLGAPAILAQDRGAGLLLLEDLGDDLVARVLDRDPAAAGPVYARVTDLLIGLHRHPVPGFVAPLDGPRLAEQADLFAECYPGGVSVAPLIAALHADLAAGMAPVLALRDFHAENLVWRGEAPLGLLDYQDAVACHPAYDLASALQDARRDVDPAIEAACVARYLAATGLDPDRFRAAYALLGAQRNLRILGIFARLCLRDGKPRYLDFMPRVWGYVQRNLDHPALAPLARALARVPAPDAALVESLRSRCAR